MGNGAATATLVTKVPKGIWAVRLGFKPVAI